MASLRPLDDRVVLKVLDAEEKTAGGILLPDSAQEKPQRGKVTAVGEGKLTKDGAVDELMAEAKKTAALIASMPPMAAIANKEMVNSAYEMTLEQGLVQERRLFQILTASEDKAEGMAAFIEKREGNWKGR